MRLSPLFRPVGLALGLLLCAALAGCLETPLGDPAAAPTDARIEGLWQIENSNEALLLVKPWGDGHTYAVSDVRADITNGARTLNIGRVYKTWLTKIKDTTFITLDSTPSALDREERPFVIAKLEFQGDSIVATPLDATFIADAKTPAALEKLVSDNLDNPKLFAKDKNTYKRTK